MKASLVAGLFASLLAAQGQQPGNSGWQPPDPQTMIQKRVNYMATQLSLTDAQKAQATTIFTNALTADQSVRSSMQTNRQALTAAIKSNDTATIDRLAVTEGNLVAQATATDSKAQAAFYALLTADQKAKYDALPHHGGAGGPGPMGGGFGPHGGRPPRQ